MKVIGSFVSPYVRKVLACLELKGVAYEIDPITPFFGNDEFTALSPLRRIPVLIDGDLVLTDSSVIAAYIDEAYPDPPLLPATPAKRARARWFEEYADTRLGDVFIWGLFYPKFVQPLVWGEPSDEARIERTLSHDVPRELDYLERELPAGGFIAGEFGLADIAVASFFRNAFHVGFSIDQDKWPHTAAYIARTLAQPVFEKLRPFEEIQLGTSIAGRRRALIEAGARITEHSLAERVPRKGIMKL